MLDKGPHPDRPQVPRQAINTMKTHRTRSVRTTGVSGFLKTPRGMASAAVLAAMLGLSACTTVEDTWDSTWDAVFGDDDMTTAASIDGDVAQDEAATEARRGPSDGLVASRNRPAYDEGAVRREPAVRHALVDEPAETRMAADTSQDRQGVMAETLSPPAPPPPPRAQAAQMQTPTRMQPQMQAQASAPTPAQPQAQPRVPMMAASGDDLATPAETMRPLPIAAAQPLAPAGTPEQGLLIAPVSGAGTESVFAYDDAATNGLGTTVIGGDGRVAIEPYVPVEYVAGGGVREGVYASEYDGPYAGRGLQPYGGPQSMDSFTPTGAGVSTLVATIQFGHGSARLGARDRKVLRDVVKLQKRYGGTVRVIGHASSRTANMTMDKHKLVNFTTSSARAASVTDALARLGVPRDQIYSAAVSDNDPVYYEVMPSGEAGNRRTEIYLDY